MASNNNKERLKALKRNQIPSHRNHFPSNESVIKVSTCIHSRVLKYIKSSDKEKTDIIDDVHNEIINKHRLEFVKWNGRKWHSMPKEESRKLVQRAFSDKASSNSSHTSQGSKQKKVVICMGGSRRGRRHGSGKLKKAGSDEFIEGVYNWGKEVPRKRTTPLINGPPLKRPRRCPPEAEGKEKEVEFSSKPRNLSADFKHTADGEIKKPLGEIIDTSAANSNEDEHHVQGEGEADKEHQDQNNQQQQVQVEVEQQEEDIPPTQNKKKKKSPSSLSLHKGSLLSELTPEGRSHSPPYPAHKTASTTSPASASLSQNAMECPLVSPSPLKMSQLSPPIQEEDAVDDSLEENNFNCKFSGDPAQEAEDVANGSKLQARPDLWKRTVVSEASSAESINSAETPSLEANLGSNEVESSIQPGIIDLPATCGLLQSHYQTWHRGRYKSFSDQSSHEVESTTLCEVDTADKSGKETLNEGNVAGYRVVQEELHDLSSAVPNVQGAEEPRACNANATLREIEETYCEDDADNDDSIAVQATADERQSSDIVIGSPIQQAEDSQVEEEPRGGSTADAKLKEQTIMYAVKRLTKMLQSRMPCLGDTQEDNAQEQTYHGDRGYFKCTQPFPAERLPLVFFSFMMTFAIHSFFFGRYGMTTSERLDAGRISTAFRHRTEDANKAEGGDEFLGAMVTERAQYNMTKTNVTKDLLAEEDTLANFTDGGWLDSCSSELDYDYVRFREYVRECHVASVTISPIEKEPPDTAGVVYNSEPAHLCCLEHYQNEDKGQEETVCNKKEQRHCIETGKKAKGISSVTQEIGNEVASFKKCATTIFISFVLIVVILQTSGNVLVLQQVIPVLKQVICKAPAGDMKTKSLQAVIKIQSIARGCTHRRSYSQIRRKWLKAVVKIQSNARARIHRSSYFAARRGTVMLQAVVRGAHTRSCAKTVKFQQGFVESGNMSGEKIHQNDVHAIKSDLGNHKEENNAGIDSIDSEVDRTVDSIDCKVDSIIEMKLSQKKRDATSDSFNRQAAFVATGDLLERQAKQTPFRSRSLNNGMPS